MENINQVLEAGADSIAVISAITKADDVAQAVREWEAVFQAQRGHDTSSAQDSSTPAPRILEEQR